MSICLATGSEVVLDLMCTVPIVFCDVGGYAINQYFTYHIMKNLSYNIVLGMYWIKSTKLVIDWLVFY